MRFATIRQIVLLTVVWCAALFLLDYAKNPHLWRAEGALRTSDQGAHVDLWMAHLCCTGCLGDIRAALADVPGLGTPTVAGSDDLLTPLQADVAAARVDRYERVVRVPVTDLAQLDFVAVDAALRDKGFIAGRMEFGGVDHVRIEAELSHFCCGVCEKATYEGLTFFKTRGQGGRFTWLDSVSVDKAKQRVIAYARYLEPGKTIDVAELIAGLGYVGFAPRAVRIFPGDE